MSELKIPVTVSMEELRGGRTVEELLAIREVTILIDASQLPGTGVSTRLLESMMEELDVAIGVADLLTDLSCGSAQGERVSIKRESVVQVMGQVRRICRQVSADLQDLIEQELRGRRPLDREQVAAMADLMLAVEDPASIGAAPVPSRATRGNGRPGHVPPRPMTAPDAAGR